MCTQARSKRAVVWPPPRTKCLCLLFIYLQVESRCSFDHRTDAAAEPTPELSLLCHTVRKEKRTNCCIRLYRPKYSLLFSHVFSFNESSPTVTYLLLQVKHIKSQLITPGSQIAQPWLLVVTS
ncbi:hypothetical protein ATANTOWER_003343 [Ataeniobius toweri]|uniref:Secreted protein n=1 Tax=Ataeniobius toweri TaxID=208326 RepID=A0ABU7C8L5_9TELE|nr:hypothetical protein [Ataeniobius toweri]